MVESGTSKGVRVIADCGASTRRARYPAWVWLNLVCLDAPFVAISWQWLFACSFKIPIARGGTAALFLTAWFIYLADRFGDNLSLDQAAPKSLRQYFCWRHRAGWLIALAVIGIADSFVIFTQLDPGARLAGAGVGAGAVVYLIVNQVQPSIWQRMALKEISIGFLFAAGTIVGLIPGLTSETFIGWFLFACLCALNCICIAVWERELDLAQERISIATVFPAVGRYLLVALILLCLTSLLRWIWAESARNVNLCVATSAFALGLVHLFRHHFDREVRTALADLVLLTPLAAFAFTVG